MKKLKLTKAQAAELYGVDFMEQVYKADTSDPLRGPRGEPDDKKVSESLQEAVANMIAHVPSLNPTHAARWLMYTDQGQAFLAQHKKETKPMDITKAISVMEDVLMAQVTKVSGESYAKSFATKYENDIEFRKQWRNLTDAKLTAALGKGMATLTPTSVGVGDTSIADDSAEAVRLLSEMAEKQGRTFEQVFADPANAKTAAKTYTSAHRSSVSYDAELEG